MLTEVILSFLVLSFPALCGYFYIGNQRRYQYNSQQDLSLSEYLRSILLPFLVDLRAATSTLASDLALPIHIYQVNPSQEEDQPWQTLLLVLMQLHLEMCLNLLCLLWFLPLELMIRGSHLSQQHRMH